MAVRQITLPALLAVSLLGPISPLAAQTIAIGDSWAERGQAVIVKVMLWSPTTMTAALLRLECDPSVLENPSAEAGSSLSPGHILDWYSPEPGRLNVVIYPVTGMPGFTVPASTLCILHFDVRPDAAAGL